MVSGTWYRYLVPGAWYMVSGTWYQVSGTRYLVPGTTYHFLSVVWLKAHRSPQGATRTVVPHGLRAWQTAGVACLVSRASLVPGIRYQVLGSTCFLVPATGCLVLGISYLVPGPRTQEPGTCYKEPGARYLAAGSRYQVPGTCYQVLSRGYEKKNLLTDWTRSFSCSFS